jgi:hypothetical protein
MKNNLGKRSWNGSLKWFFCHKYETIKHILFECQFARATWNMVQVATNL